MVTEALKATSGPGVAGWRYPGWRVVALGFVIFFFGFGGPTSSMPLVYSEVMHEFGWTRTTATLIYTWKGVTGAAVAIFLIGPLVERFGLKPVFITVITAEAIGFATFYFVHSIWTYYVTGFLIGLGQGAVLLCIKLLVSRWFMRNVGFACAIAIAGASFGGVVFPLYLSVAIPELGWRLSFALIGIGIFVVSVPLILIVNQNPTEKEILPEAVGDSGARPSPAQAEALKAAEIEASFGEIIRMPMFWCMTVSIVIIAGVDQGLFQHSQLYFTREAGLSQMQAASALSITFLIGLFAKFVAGKFFDRTSIRGISFWYLLIAGMVLLALPVSDYRTAMIFTFALGFANGGIVTEAPVMAKHVYGPRHMNRVLPILTGCFALGSSGGPVFLAMIYDSIGGYFWGFILYAALAVLAAFLIWQVRPMYRDRLREVTGATA
ncbi:MAG TPA: MFS transporter [Sphingomonadaceae bacterium]|nr:MFS transporter [Sphingomonadaceae bacterium]